MVKLLVFHNADFKAFNIYSMSQIHIAVLSGTLDIIKYLVETGKAEIEAVDWFGRTPLHFACSYGKADILKYLVDKGVK